MKTKYFLEDEITPKNQSLLSRGIDRTVDCFSFLSFNQRRALFLLCEGKIAIFNNYSSCLSKSEKEQVMSLTTLNEIK